MLHPVPWNETATLTGPDRQTGMRAEIATGNLRSLLRVVESLDRLEVKDCRIAFPERSREPYSYGPESFEELIALAKPGWVNG
jgi:hypothetical protein